jgi:filamentous hemagglutinin family protein
MNKTRYRLIFCKLRCMLVPVAEGLPHRVGGAGVASEGDSSAEGSWMGWLRPIGLAVLCLLSAPLAAQVVDRSTQTVMSTTANGVPLVNIAAPNANGLSHNRFREFDVQRPGVVFNNSQADGVSAIGGYAMKNPHLMGASPASAILAEVTGSRASLLSGAIEVFGRRADVLVANPNGITLNGVSTVNANSLTATTGRFLESTAAGVRFGVDGGTVRIEGEGVNTNGLSYFDVVARNIELQGAISGDTPASIKMIAGMNEYESGSRTYRKVGDGSGAVGITGTAAGAMYGRDITLVATESGAGVRHAGAIASDSDITVDAAGEIRLGEAVQARKAIGLQGQAIAVEASGKIQAGQALSVQTQQGLTNDGQMQAQGALQAKVGGDVVNRGRLLAAQGMSLEAAGGLENTAAAVLQGSGAVTLKTGAVLRNAGQVRAGSLVATSGQAFENIGPQAHVGVTGDASLTAASLRNEQGQIEAEGALSVHTQRDVQNLAGARIDSGAGLAVEAGGKVVNARGSKMRTLGDLKVSAQGDVEGQGVDSELLGDTVALNAGGAVRNTAGSVIEARHELVLDAKAAIENQGAQSLLLGKQARLRAGTNVVNADGAQIVGTDVEIASKQNLRNTGLIGARQALNIASGGNIENQGAGSRVVGEQVQLQAGTDVINADGAQIAGADLNIVAKQSLRNAGGGVIGARQALQIAAGSDIDNTGADSQLLAQHLVLNAQGAMRNADGARVQGVQGVQVKAKTIDNADATILGGAVAGDGTVVGVGSVTLEAEQTLTNRGTGQLLSTGALAARAGQRVANADQGRMAADALTVKTAAFKNAAASKLAAGRTLQIEAQSYANLGQIESARDATLSITNGQDLVLGTGTLTPKAAGTLTLNGQNIRVDIEVDNPGDIVLNAAGDIENRASLMSGGSIRAKAVGKFANAADALLWSAQDVSVDASEIENARGAQIEAQRDLTLTATAAVRNAPAARLTAGRDLAIDTPVLKNQAALDGDVVAGAEQNAKGTHANYHSARHDYYEVTINGIDTLESTLTVRQGVVEAGRDIRLNQGANKGTHAQVDNAGLMQAGQNIQVDGDLKNVSLSREVSVVDYLKRPATISIWGQPWSNINTSLDDGVNRTLGSLWELLEFITQPDGAYAHTPRFRYNLRTDQVLNALKQASGSSKLNEVLSQVLGADWKGADRGTLQNRWNAYKQDSGAPGFKFYPNRQTQMVAGGKIVHTGGGLINGEANAQRLEQQAVQVKVGDRLVGAVRPDLAVRGHFRDLSTGLDVSDALLGLIGNRKFAMNQLPAPADLASGFAQGSFGKTAPKVYPLYETRLKYVDQGNLLGSEYFFEKVGYQPQRTVAVIGDAYFLNQLIERQVESAVGGYLVRRDGITNGLQVQRLMDNAAAVATRLGLSMGIEPTPEQLAKLDKDIVWYVSQQVEGQSVLVPKVYLAPKTVQSYIAYQKGGAAAISANEGVLIEADAGGVHNVNGLIEAGGNVTVRSAGAIENVSQAGVAGGIRSGEGTVDLQATGDITNDGAAITGQDVRLNAGGSITERARLSYDAEGKQVVQSQGIAAQGKDGKVRLEAGRDVKLVASQIDGHDVRIQAKGDIVSGDLYVTESSFKSETDQRTLGYTHTEETTVSASAVGSRIRGGKDGGSLVMKADGNVDLKGGAYSADQGLIRAGKDIITRTSQDYSHEERYQLTEQFVADANAGVAGYGAGASYGGATGGKTDVVVGGKAVGKPAADGKLNEGKAVLSELAGGFIGYQRSESRDTQDALTNRNAALNFGKSLDVLAETGTLDIGGADLKAKGDLLVRGAKLASTKYEDVLKQTSEHTDMRFGLKVEGHSSLADAANHVADHVQDAKEGKKANVGATVAQVVGDVTNVLFNDTAGSSQSLSYTFEKTKERSRQTRQNINTLSGTNVRIQQTQGDMALKGVDIKASDQVTLEAAGKVELTAAEARSESGSDYQMHQVTVGVNESVNAVFQTANAGASLGYNGALDKTASSTLSHTNSKIEGARVTIKSGGDTVLKGANVAAKTVDLDIKGDLKLESVQDESTMKHEKADWGAQVGTTLGASGQTGPAAARAAVSLSVNGGYGMDWDNSKLTARQSGITASESLNGKVGGDLRLKGAVLGSDTGNGSLKVAGKTTTEDLQDVRNKDGGYGGVGLSLTLGGSEKIGTSGVNVKAETVDQVFYKKTNKATIGVKDFTSAGGVQGRVNRDMTQTTQVTEDWKTGGVTIAATVDLDPFKKKKEEEENESVKKNQSMRAEHDLTLTKSTPKGQVGATSRTRENPETARTKPQYEQRLVVQVGNDKVTQDAAHNLQGKHSNTVLVKRQGDGSYESVTGELSQLGGKTKVQVVGHGGVDNEGQRTLGGLDAATLARDVAKLLPGAQAADPQGVEPAISKVTLVGCETGCGKDSLAAQLQTKLAEQGTEVGEVKGRDTYVKVDAKGHKHDTTADDPQALPVEMRKKDYSFNKGVYVNNIHSAPSDGLVILSNKWMTENNCASCTAAGAASLIKHSHGKYDVADVGKFMDANSHGHAARGVGPDIDLAARGMMGTDIDSQVNNIASYVKDRTGISPTIFRDLPLNDAESKMRSYPDGTVFAVMASGKTKTSSDENIHWLNAVVKSDKLSYIDFQTNRPTRLSNYPYVGGDGPSTSGSPFIGIVQQNRGVASRSDLHNDNQDGTFLRSSTLDVLAFPPASSSRKGL